MNFYDTERIPNSKSKLGVYLFCDCCGILYLLERERLLRKRLKNKHFFCSKKCSNILSSKNRNLQNRSKDEHIQKFNKKVNKEPGLGPWGNCWEWTGSKTAQGYGRYKVFVPETNKLIRYTHRSSYYFFNGAIPEGLVVRHKCDNPPCVNPDHLELGTQLDNIKDMFSRG